MTGKSRKIGDVIGEIPDWAPHERPSMPGSASTPDMPPLRRLGFGLTALVLGLTGGMGTAIVSVNMPAIQGAFGLDVRQGVWLSTTYAMFSISMNLILIKYRQQFGLTSFAKVFLAIYAVATLSHLFVDTYAGALIVRAISGMAGAALGALAVMYMMQALPPKQALKVPALLMGLGVSQLAAPLVWIISPHLLEIGGWRNIYLLQCGMALACLMATQLLRLPPGIRVHVFEWRDVVSFTLLGGGLGLLVAVANVGRLDWWLEAPWIGWALAASVLLLAAGMGFEHYRAHPIIDTRWVFSIGFLNFALSIMLARVLLTEQPFGVTGLVQAVGMGQDQTQLLYTIILAATVAGVLGGAFSLMVSTKLLPVQLLLALILVSVAAFLDSHATVNTRPADLYLSQGLMGFAAALFMGSAIILGIGQLVTRGLGSVITFSMMFGVTQTVGGMAGGAALSSLQMMRTQHHASYLAEGLAVADPVSAQAVQIYAGAYASTIGDPVLRSAQGASTLAQQLIQQANILAFNDVFFVIGWGAVALLVFNIAMFVVQGMKTLSAPRAEDDADSVVPI